MAHYAQLDEAGIVMQVVVVDDEYLQDEDGVEREDLGAAYLERVLGAGPWVQTSYSGSLRGRFAGVGYTYDAAQDRFLTPQPYPSWTLDEESGEWTAPLPRPESAEWFTWSEDTQTWEDVRMRISKVQFALRFSLAERVAIRESMDPVVHDFHELTGLAENVQLDHATVIAGVGYLESAGILAAGRAAEILSPD